MAGEELELFIHSQGAKPKIAVAYPHEVLRDVLVREEIIKQGQDDMLIFVGESEEAHSADVCDLLRSREGDHAAGVKDG